MNSKSRHGIPEGTTAVLTAASDEWLHGSVATLREHLNAAIVAATTEQAAFEQDMPGMEASARLEVMARLREMVTAMVNIEVELLDVVQKDLVLCPVDRVVKHDWAGVIVDAKAAS